jgi:hypothetical protein
MGAGLRRYVLLAVCMLAFFLLVFFVVVALVDVPILKNPPPWRAGEGRLRRWQASGCCWSTSCSRCVSDSVGARSRDMGR